VSTPAIFSRRAKSSESFFSTVQTGRRYGRQDCKQRHDAGTCYGGDLSRVYGGGSRAGTIADFRCDLNYGSAFLCRACACHPSLSPRKHGIRSTLLNEDGGSFYYMPMYLSVIIKSCWESLGKGLKLIFWINYKTNYFS
jgi:hypothetical protein